MYQLRKVDPHIEFWFIQLPTPDPRYGTLTYTMLELGHSAERNSIRFTSVASSGAEVIYELWSALSNVLAKLLTVISLGLALNVDAQ